MSVWLLPFAAAPLRCSAWPDALAEHQRANDVIMGFNTLRRAYDTDVTPILAMARYELGGAIDPIAAYRASEWRVRKAQVRKPIAVGQAGIV